MPSDFAQTPALRLKFSWNFAHPLTLDEEGLCQRLTFPEGPWTCVIPWSAVFGLGPSQRPPTWLWPMDLPDEMKALLSQAHEEADAPAEKVETEADPPRAIPALLATLDAEAEVDPTEDEEEPAPPDGIQRGHLRLVKS